jgi:GNAT superfamily N-acetyltransferase
MTPQSITLRTATAADIAGIDTLLSRAYPRLLKADYPPSLLVMAIPRISRAQPGLITSGTYHVATDDDGRILAAGGWTRAAPGQGRSTPDTGHIRHVVTDDRLTRQGIGRALLTRVIDEARATGMARLDCLSTLTAVPFYRALGFAGDTPVTIPLGPGIDFPAVALTLSLHAPITR